MSPGSIDGRNTANFSDNGLAIAAVRSRRGQKAVAACRSMNANVMHSDNPAAVSTWRIFRSRSVRGS